MLIYILIAIISLVFLMVIHELGHFLVAKKFNVKVEEFGIGIPPRIIGKKINETIYSLNLLPIGAFVKMYGEDEKVKDERSFSEKSILQRALILLGGVIAFWIAAFIILTIIMATGSPVAVDDDFHDPNAQVMIHSIIPESAANEAGLIPGDVIKSIGFNESQKTVNKSGDVREFIENYQINQVNLLIERGREEIELSVGPLDENMLMGVSLVRTSIKKYSFYEAPIQGAMATGRITYFIVSTLGDVAVKAVSGKPLPEEVKVAGPIAIVGDIFVGALEDGITEYLMIIVILSISLAIFNLLPIPALDGGRLLLLIIEKIKGSPLNPKLEKNLVAVSFLILLGIFVLVTIYDIQRFF